MGARPWAAIGPRLGRGHGLSEYLWRVAVEEAESLCRGIWRLHNDPVSWDSQSQAESPGWARAVEDWPKPAPGHTEAWAPRHPKDTLKVGDQGQASPSGGAETEDVGGCRSH